MRTRHLYLFMRDMVAAQTYQKSSVAWPLTIELNFSLIALGLGVSKFKKISVLSKFDPANIVVSEFES